jgi:hypothetical protein
MAFELSHGDLCEMDGSAASLGFWLAYGQTASAARERPAHPNDAFV